MASKGPKSKVVPVIPAPVDSIPAALAATPSTKPVPSKPVIAADKPVTVKPTPVAPKPAVAAPEPVVAAPEPVVAAPKPVAAPEPVATPEPVVAAEPAIIAPEPVPAIETPAVASPAIVPPAAPISVQPKPKPVVASVANALQKEEEVMETIQSATENVQARAQTIFADVNDRTKTAIEKSTKMIEEMNEFSKGNIEALVESSKIAAKGIETLGQEAADYGRKQYESATAALKTLSSVKSPTDFLKLHSEFMRSAFDSMVAETSKNTESMLKLAGEIAQPISNRVALAAEKAKIAA